MSTSSDQWRLRRARIEEQQVSILERCAHAFSMLTCCVASAATFAATFARFRTQARPREGWHQQRVLLPGLVAGRMRRRTCPSEPVAGAETRDEARVDYRCRLPVSVHFQRPPRRTRHNGHAPSSAAHASYTGGVVPAPGPGPVAVVPAADGTCSRVEGCANLSSHTFHAVSRGAGRQTISRCNLAARKLRPRARREDDRDIKGHTVRLWV